MMMQYIRTKQAEENWSLHQYNFLAGSRKTKNTRTSFGRLDKNSNAKQSQTSAGGKSDSPNIFFKN
jgi:hypothetical protein